MKPSRERKCQCCGEFYLPDYRTRDRQRYCDELRCRRQSHVASQQRWLAKSANRDYFHGPEHRERMRQWRQAHPNHQRRPPAAPKSVNDDCSAQPVATQDAKPELAKIALQDDCQVQLPLIVGLISNLTGLTLHDDIARSLRQYHSRGQQILGGASTTTADDRGPESAPKGNRDVGETTVVPRPTAAGAAAIQLDRSPPGTSGACAPL